MSATVVPRRAAEAAPMTHRQILEAMTGLLAALFTAMLLVHDRLGGAAHDHRRPGRHPAQYTWVITAALLATTVSTPIWGKLADLFDKKRLVQVAIVDLRRRFGGRRLRSDGALPAGHARRPGPRHGWSDRPGPGDHGHDHRSAGTRSVRRLHGLGDGVSTVSGPLLGGLLVDTALGWRWCFFVCVPLAVISLFVIQAHAEGLRRRPRTPRSTTSAPCCSPPPPACRCCG